MKKITEFGYKMQFNLFRLVRKTPFLMFYFRHRKWGNVKEVSEEEARNALETLRKRPAGHAYWDGKSTGQYRYDLSVIVPVYKAEKYVRKCIESILSQQTDYSFELVLVNDGSPDNSGKILDCYADRENVQVIHKENGGAADARNRALEATRNGGKYLMFVDSDDYLPQGAVQALMQEAVEGQYDIVEGGYDFFNDAGAHSIFSRERQESYSGEGLTGFPCMKVFRNVFFDRVCFPKGFWAEDTIIFSLIQDQANKTLVIPDVVYCYYDNPQGLTGSTHINAKTIDDIYVMEEIYDVYQKLGIPVNDAMRKRFISHFGTTTYGANMHLGLETSRNVFLITAQAAERFGFVSEAGMQNLSYWEQQVELAFKNRQFERYREAIAMM